MRRQKLFKKKIMEEKINNTLIEQVEQRIKSFGPLEDEFENLPEDLKKEFLEEEKRMLVGNLAPSMDEEIPAEKISAEIIEIKPKTKEAGPTVNTDGSIRIEIAPDQMSASAELFAHMGNGKPLDMAFVMHAVKASGIIKGIDEPLVFRAIQEVNRTRISKKITIARGREPEKGKDSKIEFNVRFPFEEIKKSIPAIPTSRFSAGQGSSRTQ